MEEEVVKKLLSCSGWLKPSYIKYGTYTEIKNEVLLELGKMLGTELNHINRYDKGNWTVYWSPNSYKVILVNEGGEHRRASIEVYHLNDPQTRKALEEAYEWAKELVKLICGE